jgi:glutathione S-transferase
MQLYFAPLACSLATRIALYEAGVDATFTQVDTAAKRLADGSDYFAIAPMGQVPALRTDDGNLLTENTAVLQYVADAQPRAHLAPTSPLERARLQQWLGFIGTELHKAIFVPLLDRTATDAVKQYARDKVPLRLGVLQNHLVDREFLQDDFSIADAYLTTVLNWAAYTGVDLGAFPAVRDYYQRLIKRPAIAKALTEEVQLYQQALRNRAAR